MEGLTLGPDCRIQWRSEALVIDRPDMWPTSAAIIRHEIFAFANPIRGAVTLLAHITRL